MTDKPKCFANYADVNFCHTSEKDKKCPFKSECFDKAQTQWYFSKTPWGCQYHDAADLQLCGRAAHFYLIEFWHSCIEQSYCFMEHWFCDKHLETQKENEVCCKANVSVVKRRDYQV
ncbi:MAG: hypothetical protein WC325_11175 [Candidatus Bathyarchaeia archaeon]